MSGFFDLTSDNYPFIEGQMLDLHPRFTNFPACEIDVVADESEPRITWAVVEPITPVTFDTRLSSQLSEIHSVLDGPPHAFYFTAYSAIPVADTIRAYYETLGIDMPMLHSINANHRLSRLYFSPPAELRDKAKSEIRSEQERINETTKGIQNACIVEQFVSSGSTMRLAAHLLHFAGVQSLVGIRGRWYSNAFKEDVDRERLTSSHASFFHEIGIKAAAQ